MRKAPASARPWPSRPGRSCLVTTKACSTRRPQVSPPCLFQRFGKRIGKRTYLPLRHPRQIPHRRRAAQYPHELRVRRHLDPTRLPHQPTAPISRLSNNACTYRALVENHTPLWIQPHCQHRRQHPAPAPPQRIRLLRHRDGVQVDDREQQLGAGHSGSVVL